MPTSSHRHRRPGREGDRQDLSAVQIGSVHDPGRCRQPRWPWSPSGAPSTCRGSGARGQGGPGNTCADLTGTALLAPLDGVSSWFSTLRVSPGRASPLSRIEARLPRAVRVSGWSGPYWLQAWVIGHAGLSCGDRVGASSRRGEQSGQFVSGVGDGPRGGSRRGVGFGGGGGGSAGAVGRPGRRWPCSRCPSARWRCDRPDPRREPRTRLDHPPRRHHQALDDLRVEDWEDMIDVNQGAAVRDRGRTASLTCSGFGPHCQHSLDLRLKIVPDQAVSGRYEACP